MNETIETRERVWLEIFVGGWYGLDIFSRKVADNRAYKVCYYIHQILFQANE